MMRSTAALVVISCLVGAPAAKGATFVAVADVPLDPAAAGLTVLDAREADDFARGHIPGAQRVAWTDYREGLVVGGRLKDDHAALARRLAELGVARDRRVLVCGAARAGWGEEGRVAWMLETLGHPAVAILDGGCAAWTRAGRAFTTVVDAPRRGAFPARLDERARADKAQVLAASRGGGAILDVRTRAEYDGATPFLEARGGHIPTARHLEWTSLVDADGRVVDRAAALAALTRAGVDPARPIVVYCTGGVRSAFVVELLRGYGVDARNYDGSFWEWAADGALPVDAVEGARTP